jgi:hypothetical protein
MPPRIEPQHHQVFQPVPPQPVMRPRAETARPAAAETVHPAAVAHPTVVRHPAMAALARAAVAPQRAAPRPPAQAAPMMGRTVAREAPGPRPDAGTARAGGPAVEPLQQSMPQRVVEMLNAARGRQAVTAIAQANRPAANIATAPPAPAAETRPVATPAEPRIAVTPATPTVRFSPKPAARATFTGAVATNTSEQARQANARQAFENALQTRTAEEARPAGAPGRPRAIIDQRV